MAANITNEQIIEHIEQMTALQLKQLVSAIEEKFGVTAAVAVAAGPVADGSAEAADVAKTVSVFLTAPGQAKLAIIKKVKEITGKDLKDAKTVADTATDKTPQLLKADLSAEDAEALKKEIEATGASVVVK